MKLSRMFAAHRTYLGVLLGVATWLLFVLLLGNSGLFVAEIALLIAMWISCTDEPKRLAAVGTFIGLPAGIYEAVHLFQQMGPPTTSAETLGRVALPIALGPMQVALIILLFSLEGLAVGNVVRLHKRGAIF